MENYSNFLTVFKGEFWNFCNQNNLFIGIPESNFDKVKIAIQINGKLRSEIEVEKDREEESVKSLAVTDKKIEKYLEGNEIKKIIYVPGKIINIVI